MNIEAQLQPGDGPKDKLANATLDDLIRELKTRCNSLVFVALADDDNDEGREHLIRYQLGGKSIALGLLAQVQHDLLHEE